MFQTNAYINGEWRDPGKRFSVRNPANQHSLAEVADCGAAETEAAIAAAHAAFPAWAGKTAHERGALLRRWFELMVQERERLALAMTREGGKPLSEARAEAAYGADFVDWYAEEAKRAYGRTIPANAVSRRYVSIKQPVGVAAAITPWNFPMAMITRKAAPALAAGCCFVVKPPSQTPLTALILAELAARAGIAPGVFNVVTGSDSAAIGRVLCESALVRKFSFTGSTAVGKKLGALCVGSNVKRLSLELGGNAPLIVFADADLDMAVKGAIASKFRNAGQTCVCANRLLIQDEIYEVFAEKFTEAVKALKVGNGEDQDVQIGPLIDEKAIKKVTQLVEDAIEHGAKVRYGGAAHPAGVNFFTPTVLTDVMPAMRVNREEIFGPVAPLIRFDSEDQAIAMANDTPFGLSGYLFTQNVGRAWRVAERMETGMVSINEGVYSNAFIPFGGVKQSGLGREGGAEGLEEYLETKFLNFGGIS